MARFVCLFALSAFLMLGSGAKACSGSGNIFADDFTDDSGGWQADPALAFGPKGVVVTILKSGVGFQGLNNTFDISGDVAICADFSLTDRPGFTPSGGIIFWAKDLANYYTYYITSGGEYDIWRKVNNTWGKVAGGAAPAIKTGPGTTNDLGVSLKGGVVTASLNGAEVKRFRAQPPDGPSHFGLYLLIDKAVAPEDPPVAETITSYKVSKLN